ncbi:amino acid carrier protein [Clostridium senegalense]|uniref:Alanine:cation symporter family protein n=1 Tax=Clostridium senegalense TaxID=1465809 RepID=A0A6M0H3Q3_9CLOT|nr:alanine:cation symporter family protein [Clostridium senegalense]
MESFNNFIATANNYLWGYVLIALLLVLGIYFSIGTKFVQFRYIKEMFILLLNGGNKDKKKEGSVSSFQSFCISTASKVGTGNIAGVAIAVALGGPGAVFWMWLIALIGGASCFVECTLAQIYKVKDGNAYRGGPAYYMEKGLNKRWMGVLFSILITISFGLIFNSVQANTISVAFNSGFGISKTTIGIILVVATSLIIFGGVTRIARVSEIIVPIFAIAYIIVSLLVLVLNITQLPNILKIIFQNAFGLKAITSGGLGATIMQGVKRGLFSNEAGMGSSPNAAAAAEAYHPVEQGLVQTLGVFVDTIIICSATAFIILSSGTYADSNLTGIELTQHALTSQIGSFGNYFIAICILLFAFSSIIGNYYYGESNIEFIKTNKIVLTIYRICVVGMVMFGSLVKVEFVWNIADFFMGLMAIINLIAISFLGKYAFLALKDYTAQKKAGIKNPKFKASSIPGLKNADEWED